MSRRELREHIFRMLFRIEFNSVDEMKEQEELHKSQLIYQQETFKCENEKQLETIASKDETIAILCRQNTRLDKEMGELVDKYNRIQAKAERLEKERN